MADFIGPKLPTTTTTTGPELPTRQITDETFTGPQKPDKQYNAVGVQTLHDSVLYDRSYTNKQFQGYPMTPTPKDEYGQGLFAPVRESGSVISIEDHHNLVGAPTYLMEGRGAQADDIQHIISKDHHFIRDMNAGPMEVIEYGGAGRAEHMPVVRAETTSDNNPVPVFSGSTTNVNPTEDEDKRYIIENGLGEWERSQVQEKTDSVFNEVPLTPLHPFTRMHDPRDAVKAVFNTYNRTKTPIADIEHRKSFRHIFFNRPECYVMYGEGLQVGLCQQAMYDEDFSSLYTRMPHVVKLLAPHYVTGTFGGTKALPEDNWNYLLSNRAMSISTGDSSISTKDSMTKTVEGITIIPGNTLDSRTGSTISITFQDTKNLEVYEYIRAWMLYIYKRARGIFLPPYGGYNFENTFYGAMQLNTVAMKVHNMHPYDRALEYCASLFDIVTNEADSKIIHWCKYFGIYPVSVSLSSLSSDNGQPMTDKISVEVGFRYQYKLQGVNTSLVEFNYNSGIVDHVGSLKRNIDLQATFPFLYKDIDTNTEQGSKALKQYIGAAGMFTGTPYIVMAKYSSDPINYLEPKVAEDKQTNDITVPLLRFAPLDDGKENILNKRLNLGIENILSEKHVAPIHT